MNPYEEQYKQLLEKYRVGDLTLTQFENAVQSLRWQGIDHNWYCISPSGEILIWDDELKEWMAVDEIETIDSNQPEENDRLSPTFSLGWLKTLLIVFGILFLLFSFVFPAIRLFAGSAAAEVTAIEQHYDDAGFRVWDIHYVYVVDGQSYQKEYQERTALKPQVSVFDIKYLPFNASIHIRTEQLSWVTSSIAFLLGITCIVISSKIKRRQITIGPF
ncbi:MAG: hypothetical protein ACOYJC_03450 [Christensenellales bacterium]|jgi:hypothetical protein